MTPDREKRLTRNLLVLEVVADGVEAIYIEMEKEFDSYAEDDCSDEVLELDGDVASLKTIHENILDTISDLKPMCEG